jgi:hypothetical protein
MGGKIELFMINTIALEFTIPTYSNLVKKQAYTYKHSFPIECLKHDVNSHNPKNTSKWCINDKI